MKVWRHVSDNSHSSISAVKVGVFGESKSKKEGGRAFGQTKASLEKLHGLGKLDRDPPKGEEKKGKGIFWWALIPFGS